MLTPLEAFRVGFLYKCADDGLTPDQIRQRVEVAASLVEKHAGLLGDLGSAASQLGTWGTAGAIAAPIGVGAVGGYMAHKLQEDDLDEDDVKQQELIDEMRRWARRAHEQRKSKLLLQPG